MKKLILIMILFTASANAQGCFKTLEKAFDKRGTYPIQDNMYQNVYISYIEDGYSTCVSGMVYVKNSKVIKIFLQYEDSCYQMLEIEFYNTEKQQPTITNGISEMIYDSDGVKFRILIMDLLKPKQE